MTTTRKLTVSLLRHFVNEIIHNDPRLTSRAEKAAFLVVLRQIEQIGPNLFLVESEDRLKAYEIENGHCRCNDYANPGPGHPCKHRLALYMMGYISLETPYNTPNLPTFSTGHSVRMLPQQNNGSALKV